MAFTGAVRGQRHRAVHQLAQVRHGPALRFWVASLHDDRSMSVAARESPPVWRRSRIQATRLGVVCVGADVLSLVRRGALSIPVVVEAVSDSPPTFPADWETRTVPSNVELVSKLLLCPFEFCSEFSGSGPMVDKSSSSTDSNRRERHPLLLPLGPDIERHTAEVGC